MLQTDITILEQRQKALEKEIGEALSHALIDDPMKAFRSALTVSPLNPGVVPTS